MIAYNRSEQHDLLLAQWWAAMRQTEEFHQTFSWSVTTLGAFMAFWRETCTLVFDTDERGITVAMWFQPVMSAAAAFAGLWIRPDKRRSPGVARQVLQAYESALDYWAVLIGVTKQKQLLRAHRRLGYDVLGQLPKVWDGEAAWVVFLTREGFNGRWVSRNWKRRSRTGREQSRPDYQPAR